MLQILLPLPRPSHIVADCLRGKQVSRQRMLVMCLGATRYFCPVEKRTTGERDTVTVRLEATGLSFQIKWGHACAVQIERHGVSGVT